MATMLRTPDSGTHFAQEALAGPSAAHAPVGFHRTITQTQVVALHRGDALRSSLLAFQRVGNGLGIAGCHRQQSPSRPIRMPPPLLPVP